MKVTYLGHSGFFVETEKHCLLFDYYIGGLPKPNPDKRLTVFVSHSHKDHYNREIFKLQDSYYGGGKNITYVLSRDVNKKDAESRLSGNHEILFVKAGETYELYGKKEDSGESLTVETLRSTDKGVAFLVTGEDFSLYHAGDLNLWKWEGESKAYNNNMEANYRREMEKIRGRHFDAAFVPLDPRQEGFAFGGLDAFRKTAEADVIFPMHFWKQPEIIREYIEARPEAGNIIVLQEEGKTYRI